jgi:hypothetical protein
MPRVMQKCAKTAHRMAQQRRMTDAKMRRGGASLRHVTHHPAS